MRSTSAFLMGAGTAYLFDPRQGKGRRHQLRDHSVRALRRIERVGNRKVSFVGGPLRGLVALARRTLIRLAVAADDDTVTQRIRNAAFRDVDVPTQGVDVIVENGIARLRGSVASVADSDRLIACVSKVPGVRDVAAEFKVTGK